MRRKIIRSPASFTETLQVPHTLQLIRQFCQFVIVRGK